MKACHEIVSGKVVAIDGKTARNLYNKGNSIKPDLAGQINERTALCLLLVNFWKHA